jgi:hypothetical protein
MKDPIVEEIRKVRDEHARQFNYDLHAICIDLKKKENVSGHQKVSFSPKKIIKNK